MSEDVAVAYKIILLGDTDVGKSSLLLRLTSDDYQPNLRSTCNVDIRSTIYPVDGINLKLLFWDTLGQERFRAINQNFYQNVNGVVYMYDVAARKSFERIEKEMNYFEEHHTKKYASILVANKIDKSSQRTVPYQEGLSFAMSRGDLDYVEVSAHDNVGVELILSKLVKKIMENENFSSITNGNNEQNSTVDITVEV